MPSEKVRSPIYSIYKASACAFVAMLCSALLVIWPIPHTIGARQTLLVLLLLSLLSILGKESIKALKQVPFYISGTYLALIGWIFIHSTFIAVNSADAIDGLSSDWLRFTVSLLTAYLFGYYLYTRRDSVLSQPSYFWLFISIALILPFSVHTIALYLEVTQQYISGAQPGQRLMALTEGPDKVSYLTNLTLSMCLSAIACVCIERRERKSWSFLAILLVTILIFFSQLFAVMRNGIICSTLISLATVIFIGIKSRLSTKTKLATLFIAMVIVMATAYFQSQDQRWQSFTETLPIAWDTTNNLAWLDKRLPLPTLPDGSEVNHSNYVRVAWIKEGLIMVGENPWGTGLSREAFGKGLVGKYDIEDPSTLGSTQSHSGCIDIFLAIGVPGGLLLYFFFTTMIWFGLKKSTPAGLVIPAFCLVLINIDFAARSVLDSVVRDHMFEMFLFLSGLLVAYLATSNQLSIKKTTEG